MNKVLIFVGVILFLSSTLVTAQEAPALAPIVNKNQFIHFGIWKIYRFGAKIVFSDREKGNALSVDSEGAMGERVAFFSRIDGRMRLASNGTAGRFNLTGSGGGAAGSLITEPIQDLQEGHYATGSVRFLVKENAITIFNVEDENALGEIIPATILKKNTNGMTHIGTLTSTIIDPTVVLDADNTAGPAAVMGDCLASYSGSTGIIIPCLSVAGDGTVYRVKLKQHAPNALTFDVNLEEVSRVQ